VTLLLGGARSGKSALAVEIGRLAGAGVTVVATATPSDDDMAARIERHRLDRPAWSAVEEPLALAGAVRGVPAEHLVIVDCLTLWVSNLMLAGVEGTEIEDRAGELAGVLAARPAPTVVVSNEVGLGTHPEHELALAYRDVLGRVNQRVAAAATRSLLLVAGRALPLQDPWEVLR